MAIRILRNILMALVFSAAFTSFAQAETIKIGATGGPHAEILEQVKTLAAKEGLDIKIVEFDDYQLPNAALVNGNYALEVGLKPEKDALVIESVDSPYANVIAVRTADKDKPAFAKLVKIYQSPEIKAFIKERFGSSVVPAF